MGRRGLSPRQKICSKKKRRKRKAKRVPRTVLFQKSNQEKENKDGRVGCILSTMDSTSQTGVEWNAPIQARKRSSSNIGNSANRKRNNTKSSRNLA
jgi:hypothetical protein